MTSVETRKCAIIVVGRARYFVEEGGFAANPGGPEYRGKTRAIIPPLATILDAARQAGVAVVYSTDCRTPHDSELHRWPPHSMKVTDWANVISDLSPQDGDLVIPKTTYSGFQSSILKSVHGCAD